MKKVINMLEKSIELAKEFNVNSYTIVKNKSETKITYGNI